MVNVLFYQIVPMVLSEIYWGLPTATLAYIFGRSWYLSLTKVTFMFCFASLIFSLYGSVLVFVLHWSALYISSCSRLCAYMVFGFHGYSDFVESFYFLNIPRSCIVYQILPFYSFLFLSFFLWFTKLLGKNITDWVF